MTQYRDKRRNERTKKKKNASVTAENVRAQAQEGLNDRVIAHRLALGLQHEVVADVGAVAEEKICRCKSKKKKKCAIA